MRLLFVFLSVLLPTFVFGKGVALCPSKCPSCSRCDPWKGTCTLPRDFVNCTMKTGGPGLCYAGTCVNNLALSPGFTQLKVCQTYNCNGAGSCSLANKPDGTDCTSQSQIGAILPSVCIKGACSKVILGLSDLFPLRNIGCLGLPDGTACDTNDVLSDGESCVKGVCTFPDGTFYGLLP